MEQTSQTQASRSSLVSTWAFDKLNKPVVNPSKIMILPHERHFRSTRWTSTEPWCKVCSVAWRVSLSKHFATEFSKEWIWVAVFSTLLCAFCIWKQFCQAETSKDSLLVILKTDKSVTVDNESETLTYPDVAMERRSFILASSEKLLQWSHVSNSKNAEHEHANWIISLFSWSICWDDVNEICVHVSRRKRPWRQRFGATINQNEARPVDESGRISARTPHFSLHELETILSAQPWFGPTPLTPNS